MQLLLIQAAQRQLAAQCSVEFMLLLLLLLLLLLH
jgi:hypothetical protein